MATGETPPPAKSIALAVLSKLFVASRRPSGENASCSISPLCG